MLQNDLNILTERLFQFRKFRKHLLYAGNRTAVALHLPFPASTGGILDQLELSLPAGSQTRSILLGGDELGAI